MSSRADRHRDTVDTNGYRGGVIKLTGIGSAPEGPRFGCAYSNATDASSHVLRWFGWWQSGNPTVALPRWTCSCGSVTTDATHARELRAA